MRRINKWKSRRLERREKNVGAFLNGYKKTFCKEWADKTISLSFAECLFAKLMLYLDMALFAAEV